MAVVLEAYGDFSSLEKIKNLQLLTDFETIVASVSVPELDPVTPIQTKTEQFYNIMGGLITSYKGPATLGDYKYYILTSWYDVNPHSVYRMYEWAEQNLPNFIRWTLLSTSLTDDYNYTCRYDDGYIYWHSIMKEATYKGQRLSDNYYPGFASYAIGPQTYHMVRIWDNLYLTCPHYKPPF